jgi:hypothetical protein
MTWPRIAATGQNVDALKVTSSDDLKILTACSKEVKILKVG